MKPAEHDDFERMCIAKLEAARRSKLNRWQIFCEDCPSAAKLAIPCLAAFIIGMWFL